MTIHALAVRDDHDLINALKRGPSKPATVSFDVRWSGVRELRQIENAERDFSIRLVEDTETIAWSAQESGFTFMSDPADTSKSTFAVLGIERNGVFFSPD